MSLNVQISKNSTTYALKAEEVSHDFSRMPSQIGLPSVTGSDPYVFSLDLGICIEQITVRGIVDSSGDLTKYDLENVVRTWWDYGDTSSTLCKLQIATGSVYYGHIKNMSFKQMGALEDRWQFSFNFLVREIANKDNTLTNSFGLSAICSTIHTEA